MIFNELADGGSNAGGASLVKLSGNFKCTAGGSEQNIRGLFVFSRNSGMFYGTDHMDWRGRNRHGCAMIAGITVCRQNLYKALTRKTIVHGQPVKTNIFNYVSQLFAHIIELCWCFW